MKKFAAIISLLLVIVMTACCFASCAEKINPADTKPAGQTKAQETKAPETKPAENQTEAPTEAPTEAVTEAPTEAVTGAAVSGTTLEVVNDTITINTREQLFEFARLANEKVYVPYEDGEEGPFDFEGMTIKLGADIDLSPELDGGKHWNPICGDFIADITFDGDGHVINGMYIEDADLDEPDGYGYMFNGSGPIHGYGFFGAIKNDITIQNVTFNNCRIEPTNKHAGCVIGTIDVPAYVTMKNVTVNNFYLNGGVGQEDNTEGICFRAGGIVGAAIFGGTVEMDHCTVSNSTIIGFHNIGGLIGCAMYDTDELTNCRVENTELHFSASYSKNENYKRPEVSRYFADIFHEENDLWGYYHTDEDLANGNTYENVKAYDIRNDIWYDGEEGKTQSYIDRFGEVYPIGNGSVRQPR
ncbi:MAG: hypothetical protein II777_07925 [Clostridia bacterium]|nr:hypothetical protein [Clostridia bacterium]